MSRCSTALSLGDKRVTRVEGSGRKETQERGEVGIGPEGCSAPAPASLPPGSKAPGISPF